MITTSAASSGARSVAERMQVSLNHATGQQESLSHFYCLHVVKLLTAVVVEIIGIINDSQC